jgi:hypothetical protein
MRRVSDAALAAKPLTSVNMKFSMRLEKVSVAHLGNSNDKS